MRKRTDAPPVRKPPATLQEIEDIDREVLTCYEVSGVLHCNPYQINLQARSDAEKGTKFLPFPAIIMGTHVKIPKKPFLKVMNGETISSKEESEVK